MPFRLQHAKRHHAAGNVMQLGPLRARLTAGEAERSLQTRITSSIWARMPYNWRTSVAGNRRRLVA
jgi:hypothetical protein